MKIFHVTVRPDNRYAMVTVGGRHFSKTTVTEIQEGDMTDEIHDSSFLQVTEAEEAQAEMEAEVEVEAQAEARPKRGRKGAKDDPDS